MSENRRETIRRTYKYRAYPSESQIVSLEAQLAFCCDLYNAVLQLRRDMWRDHRISLSHLDVSKQLTELARECPELLPPRISRSTMQKTLERSNGAFQSFFRRMKKGESAGYPRFKSKRRFATLRCQYGKSRGAELVTPKDARGHGRRTGYVHWRGVGEVRLKLHRPIPADARITETLLTRQADGWHVCFAVELPRPERLPEVARKIGLDLGITNFIALSTGERIAGPRPQRAAERRVARLRRAIARKQDRRSNRRRRAVQRLAKAKLREVSSGATISTSSRAGS